MVVLEDSLAFSVMPVSDTGSGAIDLTSSRTKRGVSFLTTFSSVFTEKTEKDGFRSTTPGVSGAEDADGPAILPAFDFSLSLSLPLLLYHSRSATKKPA